MQEYDENSETFSLDEKSKRIMQSERARKHRSDVRKIKELHLIKEEKEKLHLEEKHNNMVEAKKRKKTKESC